MENLEVLKVRELNTQELRQIEGGFMWFELWGGFNFVNISGYGRSGGQTIYA